MDWTVAISVFALLVSFAAVIAAFESANASGRSATAAEHQLELVQRKIGMVTDPAKMTEILPVWYVGRMAQDYWGFGLLLRSGSILAIQQITGVSDDRQWLEVDLLEEDAKRPTIQGHPVLYRATTDRGSASVRVDQIQAAFEIWTS